MVVATKNVTETLAAYALTLQYGDIPPPVIERAKHLLLDFLGVAFGGRQVADSTGPVIDGVRDLVGDARGSATVAGEARLYPPHYAALLNGTMAHSMDFDDTHRDAILHIGTPVFAKMMEIAAVAINAGLCHTVLIASAEPTVSRASRQQALEKMASFGHPEFELPYGFSIPAFYALLARRHMHEYGTTPEQLAMVAVTMRRHAALNPSARYREEISVDDVLGSPLIAEPLHRLDCCVTTDGGGALVVTSLERACDLERHPVLITGTAQGFSHEHLVASSSLTTFLDRDSSAFANTGVSPDDVDVALLYDNFTISVIIQLEDLGFCEPGEGGAFVEVGNIGLGGALPVNPHGGLLSESHPGRAGGIMHLIEAVLQLRRDAGPRQVADAQVALVHNVGGIMSNQATAIMTRFPG